MKLFLLVILGVVAGAKSCSDRSSSIVCQQWIKVYNICKQSWGKVFCEKSCGLCTDDNSGGNSGSSKCGVSKVQQGRIINGVNAKPGAWPWIASLQYDDRHLCGATLISPKWVLTASHCVKSITNSNINKWTIKLGAHDHRQTESTVQRMNIKRVISHPGYKSVATTSENDITLIELTRAAQLNDRVALGCLPQKDVWPLVGKECYIAGWGSVAHPGGAYHTLQQVKLPIVTRGHKGCHNNQYMVCVGLGFGTQPDGKQNPNACRGDSGGPLVCQQSNGIWKLEGVASFVYTYCKYYTAYTAVNKHMDWINKYINN